ncbi:ADP-ribose pyrophosphatase YjhB (NUDIX family) [Roseimicrobium gellanilyticum]|uniref:ADP-ribose pyrophosphatase YjhB (NUDIX family) n=1 Tax=Roseimicrobium gellanilyticum TaxID=748857 RepID=A0A366H3A1_9BACT|nr:NUDIX hydrolase [Roseimicrobium gellanilyticum]RBP35538.1 ADP-ribose pyrophosphatase YjhB (NUDIX family) [Roseimicrobium gellanilyticum]
MKTLLEFSRELAAIGQAGLTYSKDPFDKERFIRLRQMAGELLEMHAGVPDFRWPDEIGYPTPKVDVRGAIFQGAQVLLIKETASGLWTLPGGWADVNSSPKENVERECLEETGYVVEATVLTSIIDRDRAGYPRHANSIFKLFFLCEITGGAPTTNVECSAIEFFDVATLPELDPHRASREDIERAYQAYQDGSAGSHFN